MYSKSENSAQTAAASRSRTLYILDEPATGLHFDDVAKLLSAFRKLIDGGGSLLVIEHNLDIIKSADWVIDMGPEGGNGGGQIVATGTPEDIAANPRSHTGHWLVGVLNAPATAPDAYPISTLTFLIIPKDGADLAKRTASRNFIQ